MKAAIEVADGEIKSRAQATDRPSGDGHLVEFITTYRDNIYAQASGSIDTLTPGYSPEYPFGFVGYPVSFSDEGWLQLGSSILASSRVENSPAVDRYLTRRTGNFEIRDDAKFLLDTSVAEWRGVQGQPWFVQLQISSYAPSNTVFKICQHISLDTVRRLACSLHDKDTGAYRGATAMDDSRDLGAVEYLPVQ